MTVRLDIRPRLTLRPEPQAAKRPRFRLPPLALPAAGYWLAMGALTYVFAHLGPHPLDTPEASASEREEPAALPAPYAESEQPAQPTAEPAGLPVADAIPTGEPVAAAEPADLAPAAQQDEREIRENRKAGRREDFSGSSKEANEEREAPAKPPQVAMSFPEFTDSSRPAKREHAADGPRIDSLFEKADAAPSRDVEPTVPSPPSPPETAPDTRGPVSSCEAAIARNNEQLDIGAARGPADVTRDAYASILQNGRYLSACSLPERTVFEICAAVKEGRAVGITVVSSPASPALNACVKSAVARLKFPQNPRLDVTHTRFDAVHR